MEKKKMSNGRLLVKEEATVKKRILIEPKRWNVTDKCVIVEYDLPGGYVYQISKIYIEGQPAFFRAHTRLRTRKDTKPFMTIQHMGGVTKFRNKSSTIVAKKPGPMTLIASLCVNTIEGGVAEMSLDVEEMGRL